ncbi:MoaD/ThiS family protein [Acinetobacter sp. ANC 4641]|uniref:MoaD/ThiS family protein n=1 Tax=Acinetobacter sp. ANC 4641 TaxID=2529847 RepID=UPI00103F140C|nr:MoaD/ThiS family protein [Acinetobacter sp. ANC 4641]TCB13655.1 MoaD/ThiS family protein [Acinetobacter sp. ANC 4641]
MQKFSVQIEGFGAVTRWLPSDLQLEFDTPVHIAAVLEQLTQQYPQAHAVIQQCACAIADRLVSRQDALNTDSALVLLSPVAGG